MSVCVEWSNERNHPEMAHHVLNDVDTERVRIIGHGYTDREAQSHQGGRDAEDQHISHAAIAEEVCRASVTRQVSADAGVKASVLTEPEGDREDHKHAQSDAGES